MSSYYAEGTSSEYIDEIKKLHNTNNQLKKTNGQLYQELESLRTQYREISEKNKENENKSNECDKLKEKIQNLENEKNELINQLEKSQSLIDNLKENQSQEKEGTKLNIKDSIEPSNSIFQNTFNNNQNFHDTNNENTNNENQNQIQQLIDDNKLLTQNLNEQIQKNEKLQQKNRIVIETFSSYFQKKFQTINQIVNFVKKEGKNSPKKTEQTTQQAKPKKTVQKKSDNSDEYNKKLTAQKLNLEMELKKIENEVIQFKHDTEIKEIKIKQEIEKKDKKISTLENENSFLKQQIIGMNSAINSIPPTFLLPNTNDKDNSLSMLQQTLAETAKQLQNSQNENKDISRQLSNAKSDNEELYNKIENKNQEIINLRIERDDYEGKFNAAYAQVENEKANNQRLSTSLNEISKKYRISQDSVNKFEKLFETQKEEISRLTSDRNSLSSLIFKIKDFIEKEEEVYKKLITENKSYKKDLKSIKNTINSIKNQSNSDNETNSKIPVTSWYCLDFDEELCNMISEIASNEGINDTSKLKYVFQTIAKHYKNKMDDLTNENKKELENQTFQTTTTNDFIVSIAKQIGLQDISPDFIKNPMKICEFQQNLSSLINECENLRKSYNYHTNLLNSIAEKLNATYDEIPNKIDITNELLADLQKEKSNSVSKQKMDKQEYKKKLEILNSKNSKINEQKDLQISKLKAQNARLSSQLKALNNLKKEIQNNTENQFNTTKTESNLNITNDISANTQLNNDNNNNNNDINTICQSQISSYDELSGQINEQNNLIQTKDKEIQRLEDEVNFWKQNMEAIRALQDKKEADNQKINDDKDEMLMITRKKFQTEKDEIIKQYELVISNIKKQNLELKGIIEKLSTSISNNESKISKLKDKNCLLGRERDQLASQLSYQKDELQRQLSINSQKLRACQLVNESNSKNQLADLQLQYYTEKRKIITFAIHLFHNYYNSEKKIDEDVYKETLTKANDDLQKLSKQDKVVRELLGITNNESVEVNLSTILMKLYQQK